MKRSKGCPNCDKPISLQKVKDWLSVCQPNITVVKYGGKRNSQSRFRCEKCGCEWTTEFKLIEMGRGCPKCREKLYRVRYGDQ